eukprot:7472683-Pyramimonas_sp.AAC.1
MVQELSQSDHVCITWSTNPMARHSILMNMRREYHQFYSIRSLPDLPERAVQRWISKTLTNQFPTPPAASSILP